MDPILGMDQILEILAMEPTTTTKIMVTMYSTSSQAVNVSKNQDLLQVPKNIIKSPTLWSGLVE